MIIRRSRLRRVHRRLGPWIWCLLLVLGIWGCCTCKIPFHEKSIVIVSQPDGLLSNRINPVPAMLGFETKLENGATIHFSNRYGSMVKVTFPEGVISGERFFTIENCAEKEVTVEFDGELPEQFDIVVDEVGDGGGHGGATIIVDPGG